MRPLAELVTEWWRRDYMPNVNRQRPPAPRQAPPAPNLDGDILSTGVPSSAQVVGRVTAALYGRNRVGKTTLACCGEGPTAILSIDPSPGGGSESVSRDDVVVYRIAAAYLPGEKVRGSEKVMAVVDAIRARTAASGKCPFKKVVVDGLNSWFDVILGEVLCIDYDNMPAMLTKGKVSTDQYVERSEKLIKYLRPIMSLPCDVWLLAQEKDHNPPKDEKNRVIGSKLLREAHPSMQEGSFYSLAISDEAARWVQNACQCVLQLYEDAEYREEKLPDLLMNGQVVPGPTQLVATGRRVRRLRCQYHPNYAAGLKAPDYRNVPEYIEAPSPEERYQALLDVLAGKRTPFGRYAAAP